MHINLPPQGASREEMKRDNECNETITTNNNEIQGPENNKQQLTLNSIVKSDNTKDPLKKHLNGSHVDHEQAVKEQEPRTHDHDDHTVNATAQSLEIMQEILGEVRTLGNRIKELETSKGGRENLQTLREKKISLLGGTTDTDTDFTCTTDIQLTVPNDEVTQATDLMRSQTDITHKFLMLTMIPGLNILSIYFLSGEDSAQYKIISVAEAIFAGAFFMYFFHLMATSQMHRIRIIPAPFEPLHPTMIFPTQIKHYPSIPVKSISEMLALRGSSIHIFFVMMATTASCISATAVTLNWLDLQRYAHVSDREMNINYLEQALAISAVFSLAVVGHYELNVHSPCHMVMHYLGVLGSGSGVWPFAIQSAFSMLSITIIVVTSASFALWACFAYYYPNDVSNKNGIEMSQGEMRRQVHQISIHCLMAQTIGSMGCVLGWCLYLWNIKEIRCTP